MIRRSNDATDQPTAAVETVRSAAASLLGKRTVKAKRVESCRYMVRR